jgi:DnaJ-class molecular chaperone
MTTYGVYFNGALVRTTTDADMANIYQKCQGLEVRPMRCGEVPPCRACAGRGEVNRGDLYPRERKRCGACNGTGRAK